MREIRPSGSEGGAAQTNAPFLPLSVTCHRFRQWRLADEIAGGTTPGLFEEKPVAIISLWYAPSRTSPLRPKAVTSHRSPKRSAISLLYLYPS